MPYSVYQHWDPLEVCVVGRSYPPEFYSWIKDTGVRELFEKIAQETEEDYQGIIDKLQDFDVEVLRPNLPSVEDCFLNGQYLPPPMCPRDYMIMIGETFYENYSLDITTLYNNIKDPSWPSYDHIDHIEELPEFVQQELRQLHNYDHLSRFYSSYDHIYERVRQQGNVIKHHFGNHYGAFQAPGAYISRVGQDLYFGTETYNVDTEAYKKILDQEFTETRNHIVNTGGHADGVYCPVAPGLIISLKDVPTYAETFPGWEVVYLPNQSWDRLGPFWQLKMKNNGKWWIPGFENNQAVIDTVETWLGRWVGYVEETVFDVNMLIIDPKNVIVFNYNDQVFEALDRYGITPHVVPFRHRYFWDGGIHCITADLSRRGSRQDYFK